jgi:Rieske Fe-S protein
LLVAALAAIFGGVSGAFPVFAGLPVFLSPIWKQKEGGSGSKFPLLRVGTIDSIPADGTPIAVPVMADKVDAWTREANQPIGSVFLRRKGDRVECFNAICPHAGCMVAFSAERNLFQCPCHTSSFETDGGRILPSPSPRDMDKLEVDDEKLKTGEVWVAFANFYPGKEHPEVKS